MYTLLNNKTIINARIIQIIFLSFITTLTCSAKQLAISDAMANISAGVNNENASLERLLSMNDLVLRNRYRDEVGERRLCFREFEKDIKNCMQLWFNSGNKTARDQAQRCLSIALEPWFIQSADLLCSQVTLQGGIDAINLDLREACYHFALFYKLTGDSNSAERSAALLLKFSKVIPTWPVWSPYYGPQNQKKPLSQSDPNTFRNEFAAGLWGDWIYYDLVLATPLLEAWDILRDSKKMLPTDLQIVRLLFDRFLNIQYMRGDIPDYSNMDAFQIRGIIIFGILLNEPDLIHKGVSHLQAMYKTGFYPDGWWHEGSFSYHKDLQTGLREIANDLLQNYSDPLGYKNPITGKRFDNLNLKELVASQSDRADQVIRDSRLPNGYGLAVHDSDWQDQVNVIPNANLRSRLFGSIGQGTLFTGSIGSETMVTLHFGPSSTHAHHDALNLNIWAKGKEVISETQYRPLPDSGSTREWHTSTAAHATVVVDELDQSFKGPLGHHIRIPQKEDTIQGIQDWPWRWSNSAALDFGKVRLFNTDFDKVQVIEADAESTYDSVVPVTKYRRTIALVKIDERDCYIVDIFRVKGGLIHDYMLHSCLQEPHEVQVSFPLFKKEGKIHKYISSLDSNHVDSPWVAAFRLSQQITLYSFFPACLNTEVIVGKGPAMRRAGEAPFVVVRHNTGESTFVAVHHVAGGGPSRVRGINLLQTDNPDVVALRVILNNRTDTILSTGETHRNTHVDETIEFDGAFAHIAQGTDANDQWSYLVDGKLLRIGEISIEGDVSHTGTIFQACRREAGAVENKFLTHTPLPTGLSLQSTILLVDPGELPRAAYKIDKVRQVGDVFELLTTDEPGLSIDNKKIKQEYFPNWGALGVVNYYIPGSALLRKSETDNQWILKQTGNAIAKTP